MPNWCDNCAVWFWWSTYSSDTRQKQLQQHMHLESVLRSDWICPVFQIRSRATEVPAKPGISHPSDYRWVVVDTHTHTVHVLGKARDRERRQAREWESRSANCPFQTYTYQHNKRTHVLRAHFARPTTHEPAGFGPVIFFRTGPLRQSAHKDNPTCRQLD